MDCHRALNSASYFWVVATHFSQNSLRGSSLAFTPLSCSTSRSEGRPLSSKPKG